MYASIYVSIYVRMDVRKDVRMGVQYIGMCVCIGCMCLWYIDVCVYVCMCVNGI